MRTERLRQISQYIQEQGSVSFSDLCRHFGTSTATMRRDLSELDRDGSIKRTHGGAHAVEPIPSSEPSYQHRMGQNSAEKRRIAQTALSCIRDGDVVMLDSSTTVYCLAMQLARSRLHVTAITNDLNIAYLLQSNHLIELILVGGVVRNNFNHSLGVFAEDMLRQLHADRFFMGLDAISPGGGASIYSLEEIKCKRYMINNSAETIALCDHTKFRGSALLSVCPVEAIHTIITGTELSEEAARSFDRFDSLRLLRV